MTIETTATQPPEMFHELPFKIAVAQVCHETNRAYCKLLGDTSQPSWEDAPQWQKDSAINGVEFYLTHPWAGPVEAHDNWSAVKVKDGWVYGEVKDPEKKTHPCLVSYDKLPADQRLKDYLFVGVIKSFLDGTR